MIGVAVLNELFGHIDLGNDQQILNPDKLKRITRDIAEAMKWLNEEKKESFYEIAAAFFAISLKNNFALMDENVPYSAHTLDFEVWQYFYCSVILLHKEEAQSVLDKTFIHYLENIFNLNIMLPAKPKGIFSGVMNSLKEDCVAPPTPPVSIFFNTLIGGLTTSRLTNSISKIHHYRNIILMMQKLEFIKEILLEKYKIFEESKEIQDPTEYLKIINFIIEKIDTNYEEQKKYWEYFKDDYIKCMRHLEGPFQRLNIEIDYDRILDPWKVNIFRDLFLRGKIQHKKKGTTYFKDIVTDAYYQDEELLDSLGSNLGNLSQNSWYKKHVDEWTEKEKNSFHEFVFLIENPICSKTTPYDVYFDLNSSKLSPQEIWRNKDFLVVLQSDIERTQPTLRKEMVYMNKLLPILNSLNFGIIAFTIEAIIRYHKLIKEYYQLNRSTQCKVANTICSEHGIMFYKGRPLTEEQLPQYQEEVNQWKAYQYEVHQGDIVEDQRFWSKPASDAMYLRQTPETLYMKLGYGTEKRGELYFNEDRRERNDRHLSLIESNLCSPNSLPQTTFARKPELQQNLLIQTYAEFGKRGNYITGGENNNQNRITAGENTSNIEMNLHQDRPSSIESVRGAIKTTFSFLSKNFRKLIFVKPKSNLAQNDVRDPDCADEYKPTVTETSSSKTEAVPLKESNPNITETNSYIPEPDSPEESNPNITETNPYAPEPDSPEEPNPKIIETNSYVPEPDSPKEPNDKITESNITTLERKKSFSNINPTLLNIYEKGLEFVHSFESKIIEMIEKGEEELVQMKNRSPRHSVDLSSIDENLIYEIQEEEKDFPYTKSDANHHGESRNEPPQIGLFF